MQRLEALGNSAPIGVFDSGVGGLTILAELLRELPGERYVYFGDTGNCPYGVRPVREIQMLAAEATRFLVRRGAKIIVVACNTASVSAVDSLRATFKPLQFVVVVPAVRPAAKRTKTNRVGIAATEASARGDYLKTLIKQYANGVEVFAVGCPRLVELAEAGKLDGPETEAAVRDYIDPMLASGIDELVLGCTHFPAMHEVFQRVAGPGVEIIDSGEAIARRTRAVLTEGRALASADIGAASVPRALRADDEFWCSGDADHFSAVASAILRQRVVGQHVPGMVRPLANV